MCVPARGRACFTVLIASSVLIGAIGQPIASPAQAPEVQDSAGETAVPDLSAEEALQAAIEFVNKLDTVEDPGRGTAILGEIRQYAEIIKQSQPRNPWLDYLYGRAFAAMGRGGDAVDRLQEFVKTREGRNYWPAHRALGDLFVDQFPRLAKPNYEKAAALKGDEPAVLFGLSRCAAQTGEYGEAIRLAQRTVSADGRRTIRYLNHLARLLMGQRQWTEAKREAEVALNLAKEAVRDQPESRVARQVLDAQYQYLIDILTGLVGEVPRAADGYLAAARYIREQAENVTSIARQNALQVLELGVRQTEPNPAPALLEEYADTLAEAGRIDDAIAEYERLLEVDPGNVAAQEALHRLRPAPSAADRPPPP